jgi:cell division septum initiation protein DivIVA
VVDTRAVAGNESARAGHDDGEPGPGAGPQTELTGDVRDPLPGEIRDPSFAASVRGYDRRSVDRYVERVNRLIAELQVSGSPRAAVRHALDRVGEQTTGILQHARETAEDITRSAREEAEQTTARARAEAEDVMADAAREADGATARARAEAEELRAAVKSETDELRTRAKDESETTIARARVDAEGRIRQAEQELTALREQAERRLHELQLEVATASDERQSLLEDVTRIATRLSEIGAEVRHAEPVTTEAAGPDGDNGGEHHEGPPESAGPTSSA